MQALSGRSWVFAVDKDSLMGQESRVKRGGYTGTVGLIEGSQSGLKAEAKDGFPE